MTNTHMDRIVADVVHDLKHEPEWTPPLAAPAPLPVNSTSVRYHITDELWDTFTEEQVAKQATRLRETGRYHLPNGGKFTIRISYDAIANYVGQNWDRGKDDRAPFQSFFNYDVRGSDPPHITQVLRHHYPNLSVAKRQEFLGYPFPTDNPVYLAETNVAWWENDWICDRVELRPGDDLSALISIAPTLIDVLVILLQDARTHKVEIEPCRPSKLHKLGIGKRRPDVGDSTPEIVLHILRRIYTGEWGGTHASPRLHYRAEHIRQQAIGSRGEGRHKEIVIEGTWVNATDVDPTELGTPIKMRSYKLTI
jgi:hypothetical protein